MAASPAIKKSNDEQQPFTNFFRKKITCAYLT